MFDALVIGGGPGGSAAAGLLAKNGWRVALVERATFPRAKVCGEFVSAANIPLFRELGVNEAFEQIAGPRVLKVGLYAHARAIHARMPSIKTAAGYWGRAVGREHLDTLLLGRAAHLGTTLFQPHTVIGWERTDQGYSCRLQCKQTGIAIKVEARLIIAAHGSWESGQLPTQPQRSRPLATDLFAFKGHFRRSGLPADIMPLLAFSGGYGGMVQSDEGRLSFSSCIRRDKLAQVRAQAPRCSAAEAVLRYIRSCCSGVDEVLDGAELVDAWLAAGPIRPGLRGCGSNGVFRVGNAAGEAHPAIAEGITMALQAGELLTKILVEHAGLVSSPAGLAKVHHLYARAWRRRFTRRIVVSALIAQWAMRRRAVLPLLPWIRRFPALVTAGARLSGKG